MSITTMQPTKIRKNFVFDKKTNDQLEKLKAVQNKSATKIVQELIAGSFEQIEQQERKQALEEFIEFDVGSFSGGEFSNKSIKELKVLMYEEKYGK